MAQQPSKKPARNPQHITPAGIFVYPYLVTPDFGRGEFTNENGIYKVNLKLTQEEAKPLLDILEPIHAEAVEEGQEGFDNLAVAKKKKLKELTVTDLYEEEYDEETEEPTGNLIFKFKTSASGVNKKTKKPWKRTINLFSAAGKKIKPPMVGGGTLGKVSFETSKYFIAGTGVAGVSLFLVAAQILELVDTMGGGTAEQFGFGAEEGYDEPEFEEAAEEEETTEAEEEDEDDF